VIIFRAYKNNLLVINIFGGTIFLDLPIY
jgi:hypothetical protein